MCVCSKIPSLEGMLTPLASHQTTRQPLSARPTLEEVDAATTRREKQRYEEDNEEDADVTVGAELTDRSSYGVGSEGSATLGRTFVVDQPKLSLAESDSVPPCPEKRPLGKGEGREGEGREGEGREGGRGGR